MNFFGCGPGTHLFLRFPDRVLRFGKQRAGFVEAFTEPFAFIGKFFEFGLERFQFDRILFRFGFPGKYSGRFAFSMSAKDKTFRRNIASGERKEPVFLPAKFCGEFPRNGEAFHENRMGEESFEDPFNRSFGLDKLGSLPDDTGALRETFQRHHPRIKSQKRTSRLGNVQRIQQAVHKCGILGNNRIQGISECELDCRRVFGFHMD